MTHPFQCLSVSTSDRRPNLKDGVLAAAAGHRLYTFSLNDGALLSVWPEPDPGQLEEDSPTETHQPPLKKHKSNSLIDGSHASNSPSKSRPSVQEKSPTAYKPAIITMTFTSDGDHLVMATGEDKCVRVFNVGTDGRLALFSERYMLKRPCAIVTIPRGVSEESILSADKFGDVYSFPLLGKAGDLATTDSSPAKAKVPSANEHTVHTTRNQQALQNQMKSHTSAVTKKTLDFEHELLLGHVSMLTDIAVARLPDEKGTSFVITCDRDEHIRVSRGPPYAHIIHGYCLGHTEFVSRICVPRWSDRQSRHLISGGGDSFLGSWDWLGGELRHTVDLLSIVRASVPSWSEREQAQVGIAKVNGQDWDEPDKGDAKGDERSKIAVSGIWDVAFDLDSKERPGTIMVACEGVEALVIFNLSKDYKLRHAQTLLLKGNVLDLVVPNPNTGSVVVSIDNVHVPGSTTVQRSTTEPTVLLQSFIREPNKEDLLWKEDVEVKSSIEKINQQGSWEREGPRRPGALTEMLYTVEKLRKRGGESED